MDAVISLARHGETPYNAERRFQGQGEVPLNATGRAQAQELARNAQGHGFVALHASPLARARETAEIVADALGLQPQFDDRFKETDTGDWTDRLFADVEREDPEGYAAYHATDPDFAFPGGESLKAQQQRVLQALHEIVRGPALVVCHRGVIRVVKCGADLSTFMSWDIPNGSLEQL